jgi:hypothetical protein
VPCSQKGQVTGLRHVGFRMTGDDGKDTMKPGGAGPTGTGPDDGHVDADHGLSSEPVLLSLGPTGPGYAP